MENYMERKNMQQVGEMPQANASQATTEMRPSSMREEHCHSPAEEKYRDSPMQKACVRKIV